MFKIHVITSYRYNSIDIKAGADNCRYIKHACKYHFMPNEPTPSSFSGVLALSALS